MRSIKNCILFIFSIISCAWILSSNPSPNKGSGKPPITKSKSENLFSSSKSISNASKPRLNRSNINEQNSSSTTKPQVSLEYSESIPNLEAGPRPNSIPKTQSFPPLEVRRRSLSSPSLEFFEEKKQKQLKPQVRVVNENYFHPEKMDAPLEKYVEKTNIELKKAFPIVEKLPQQLAELYAIEFIENRANNTIAGHNKISPNSITHDAIASELIWAKPEKLSSLQKFSAGLEALQEISKKNPQLNFSYNPEFKNQNMPPQATMKDYVTELQKIPECSHQNPVLLEQYVLAYFKENDGYFFTSTIKPEKIANDLRIDIKNEQTWPKDVNDNGNLVTKPKSSQKIYAMMEAINKINQNVVTFNNNGPQTSRYAQAKAAGSIAISTLTNLPSNLTWLSNNVSDLYKQVEPIINSKNPADAAKKLAIETILNRDRTPGTGESFLDAQDITNIREILRREANSIIENTGPSIVEALKNPNQKSSKPATPFLSETAQNILNDIGSAAVVRAKKSAIETLFTPEEIKKIKKDKQVQEDEYKKSLQKEKEAAKNLIAEFLKKKELTPFEKGGNTKIQERMRRNTRSAVTLYFIDSFKTVAEAARSSKENIKKCISSMITTFSKIKGLSNKQAAILEEQGSREVDHLLEDKSSWVNAKSSEFNVRFNTWMESFITKMYTTIGKTNQKNIQSIEIVEENPSELTPKIEINWNNNKNTVASILVVYKDNPLLFEKSNNPKQENPIIANDDTKNYEITTLLFSKPKPKSLFQKISDKVSDTIAITTLSPAEQAAQGSKAQQDITKLRRKLTTQKVQEEGVLTIKYDHNTNTLTTSIAQKNRDNGQISTTTKTYSTTTRNLLSQETILSPKADNFFEGSTDTYTPDIKITYKPHDKNPVAIEGKYVHPQTGEPFTFASNPQNVIFDAITGTYKMETALKPINPAKPLPGGIEGQIIQALQEILPPANSKAYKKILDSLDTSWSGARIAQQYPELYKAAKKWLLDDYEVGVEYAIIEFNPTQNIIGTRIISNMAEGGIQGKNSIYLIN